MGWTQQRIADAKGVEQPRVAERLGWSEIRNIGNFEQKVPNNKWVRQMEKDIGLIRNKEGNKIIWRL